MVKANPTGFSDLHTPRLDARRKALSEVFSLGSMDKVWKNYVRPGLRKQELLDLFDYNDFHWNRKEIFQTMHTAIVSGQYRPEQSLAVRLEKSQGVSRTVVIPSPEDSVVLQCIVESLLPKAILSQPSKNSFFSRSHSNPDAEFTFGKDYIWFKQWAKFTSKRIAISSAHEWVVTTDVANFFDNIHYSHLRNLISTLDDIDEVILDILFTVLDQVSWRPDYLPSVGISLPQVQFDAPRLLAHLYLFEIDAYLKDITENNFVRWVDDITFAVSSQAEGKAILRDLDSLMQLRGIHLNSGKTRILSRVGARSFFYSKENEYLNRVKGRIAERKKKGLSTNQIDKKLRASFTSLLKKRRDGHFDKVCKRYLGLFADLGTDGGLDYVLSRFKSEPSIRETAVRYLLMLPPSKRVITHLGNYLKGEHALDDSSVFQVARLLTAIPISPRSKMYGQLATLGATLSHETHISKGYAFFLASLWILTKYGTQRRLKQMLLETKAYWEQSEFLARQVAAACAKFRSAETRRQFYSIIEHQGYASANSVITKHRELHALNGRLSPEIRMYLLNGKNKSLYSIQRFLVFVTVLRADGLDGQYKKELISQSLKYIVDPLYVSELKKMTD